VLQQKLVLKVLQILDSFAEEKDLKDLINPCTSVQCTMRSCAPRNHTILIDCELDQQSLAARNKLYCYVTFFSRTQLEELNLHIQEETTKVMNELSKVEPAVQDAKAAVRSIKKQHLVEIRSMANPPAGKFVI